MSRYRMGSGDRKEMFDFDKDKAYTEDNVLIYNIFVYNIPITEKQLRDYFQEFGEIQKIDFKRPKGKRRHAPKIAFVNFIDARSAAKVLRVTSHYVRGSLINLRPSYSWHQPGGKTHKVAQSSDDMSIDDEALVLPSTSIVCGNNGSALPPNILQLNDYCLEHICKHLRLRDQLQFSRTCQRFRQIFFILAKISYKVLVLEKLQSLTLGEMREFLDIVGCHIETLVGSVSSTICRRVFEFIGYMCKNVKTIILYSMKFKPNVFKKFIHSMTNVVELELQDVNLTDYCIQYMKKLPNLKALRVPGNYELTGRFFSSLIDLVELSLFGCGNIQASHMAEICRSLTKLKSLNIQRCSCLTASSFQEISNYCQNIEVLKITYVIHISDIVAELPKLVQLEMRGEAFLRSQIFNKLVDYHSERLQCLKLKSWDSINIDNATQIAKLIKLRVLSCPNSAGVDDACLEKFAHLSELEEINLKNCQHFSTEGLLALLERCPHLKRLNIIRCKQLTDDFIKNVLKIIQGRNSKDPLLILATRSGINEGILNTTEYKTNNRKLKISFDLPFTNYNFCDDFEDIYDLPDVFDIDPVSEDDEIYFPDYLQQDISDDDLLDEDEMDLRYLHQHYALVFDDIRWMHRFE